MGSKSSLVNVKSLFVEVKSLLVMIKRVAFMHAVGRCIFTVQISIRHITGGNTNSRTSSLWD